MAEDHNKETETDFNFKHIFRPTYKYVCMAKHSWRVYSSKNKLFVKKNLQVNEFIFVLRHKIKRILVFHKKEMNHVSMYTTNSFSFCSLKFLPPFKNKCTTFVSQLH